MKSKLKYIQVFICAGIILGAGMTNGEEPQKKEFSADKGSSDVDVSKYSPDMQENYKAFASKCSKCHTLARPINTDMEANAWKMYVKRMMNKPDSGISPANGKKIYKFLKFFQAEKEKGKPSSEK